MQPTGQPHLGNYLGMLKQSVALQQESSYERFYFIADLHALTVRQDPKTFAQQTLNTAIDLLALGLDPALSTIFVQSHIPEHAELAWILNTLTPIGELKRMTQFKEKSDEQSENVNFGLLDYPVLMTADIILYKSELIPVGDDQAQHVETARVLVRKFHNRYGKLFPEPKALFTHAKRIMSLLDPKKKMSKSHGEKSFIALTDEPAVILQKVSKAVTATAGGKELDPGVANLFAIMREVSPAETVQRFEEQQKDSSIRYAELKKLLASDLAEHLAPFRKRRAELTKKESYVKEVLEEGKKKASSIAKATMEEVRQKIGLLQ